MYLRIYLYVICVGVRDGGGCGPLTQPANLEVTKEVVVDNISIQQSQIVTPPTWAKLIKTPNLI